MRVPKPSKLLSKKKWSQHLCQSADIQWCSSSLLKKSMKLNFQRCQITLGSNQDCIRYWSITGTNMTASLIGHRKIVPRMTRIKIWKKSQSLAQKKFSLRRPIKWFRRSSIAWLGKTPMWMRMLIRVTSLRFSLEFLRILLTSTMVFRSIQLVFSDL